MAKKKQPGHVDAADFERNDAIREWCEAQGVGCDEIEFLEETSP